MPEKSSLRRPMFAEGTTCFASSPTMVKVRASSGQSSRQFMQEKHSLRRTCPCGSQAPSQLSQAMIAVGAFVNVAVDAEQ